MYKYTAINDKIGKIELDNYNRDDSELNILEAKLVKESDEMLAVYAVLCDKNYDNITKQAKLPDGKYGADPSFKLEGNPIVKIDIPLTIIKKTSKAGKEYSIGSFSENFIGAKLLEDFGDGGTLEGMINLGVDRSKIDKVIEFEQYKGTEKGEKTYQKNLEYFYECNKVEALSIITDEIISQGSQPKAGYSGGKGYAKAETEAEKLNARSEFTKRFLADNWDKSIDMSVTSFDDALTMFNGREIVQKGKQGELLMEILKTILG